MERRIILNPRWYVDFLFATLPKGIYTRTTVSTKVRLCQVSYRQIKVPRVEVNHCLGYVILVAIMQFNIACKDVKWE